MIRVLLSCLLMLFLTGCAHKCVNNPAKPPITGMPVHQNIVTKEYMAQGRRYFESGFYKRAMHELLPLACDGNSEAQYAVGYMYYYGYGVAQDTDVGYFWIQRSADQGFSPAIQALATINSKRASTS
jgi:TPR repeat protein